MVSFQNPYLLLFLFDYINRFYYKIHRFRGKIIDNTLHKTPLRGALPTFGRYRYVFFSMLRWKTGTDVLGNDIGCIFIIYIYDICIYTYMYLQNVCIYVYSIYAYYESTQHSRHTNFTLPDQILPKGTIATS